MAGIRVVGTGLIGSVLPLAWNHSEPYRVARQIQRGALNVPSPSKFDERFCQFDLDAIRGIYRSDPHLFCGLVGVKSTGKTMTLKHLASQEKNCVFLDFDPEQHLDLNEVLWARLKDSVVTLPWFLDHLRFNSQRSSRRRIEDVFQRVSEQTSEKVTVVIDVTVSNERKGVSLTRPEIPKLFNVKSFTRQIKHFVADSESMRCVFSASEGLMFQAESTHESRLRLFLAKELPLDLAVKFVEQEEKRNKKEVSSKEELDAFLASFPRQFSELKAFAREKDRQRFVQESFAKEVEKIKEARKGSGTDGVLQVALSRPVLFDDFTNLEFSKEQFLRLYVETNILQLRADGGYEIQFDVTKKAIESLLPKK